MSRTRSFGGWSDLEDSQPQILCSFEYTEKGCLVREDALDHRLAILDTEAESGECRLHRRSSGTFEHHGKSPGHRGERLFHAPSEPRDRVMWPHPLRVEREKLQATKSAERWPLIKGPLALLATIGRG